MAVPVVDPRPQEDDALARVMAAARADFEWYAPRFLKVANNQRFVPMELRPAQARLWALLKEQRDSGKPMRAVILKARKMGFSTMVQGLMVQRATLRPNHNALTVAHDGSTASEIFTIGESMYSLLPNDPELAWCKPAKIRTRKGREMHFGNKAGTARDRGDLGLNSKVLVDTANEVDAGRGFTFHTLHLSEVGLWSDIRTKMTALMNTVPQDDPDTLVILESTAQGFNEFQKIWAAAEAGENEYAPFFAAWHEDPRYTKPFLSDEEREAFIDSIGTGKWGADEPELIERGLTPEQLNWRRSAIPNLCGSDLDTFRQEYPSTPEEAFLQSGRTLFDSGVRRALRRDAERVNDGAEHVWLEAGRTTVRRTTHGTVDVPVEVKERERREAERGDHYWKVWTRPEEGSGHYVAMLDPAKGKENTAGDTDYTAIQVIDHKTREQCAEWRSHINPIPAAIQLYLALMWYQRDQNRPLAVIDCTGGYGDSIARMVWKELGWRNMYFRQNIDPRRREHTADLVGFMFDRGNKPQVEAVAQEICASDAHGIRSLRLVDEADRYVIDKNGKTGAEDGAHDDLLTAWMVAQFVAGLKPPREKRSGGTFSTSNYRNVVITR